MQLAWTALIVAALVPAVCDGFSVYRTPYRRVPLVHHADYGHMPILVASRSYRNIGAFDNSFGYGASGSASPRGTVFVKRSAPPPPPEPEYELIPVEIEEEEEPPAVQLQPVQLIPVRLVNLD